MRKYQKKAPQKKNSSSEETRLAAPKRDIVSFLTVMIMIIIVSLTLLTLSSVRTSSEPKAYKKPMYLSLRISKNVRDKKKTWFPVTRTSLT